MTTMKDFALGMIGLGTMGRNLLLNMADHGYKVAGHDKDQSKIDLLAKESNNENVKGFLSINEFVEGLQKPRAIIMLVPAGKIVDQVIAEIAPLLDEGDLLIDGGNSHFTDTNRRVEELKEKSFTFLVWVFQGAKRALGKARV